MTRLPGGNGDEGQCLECGKRFNQFSSARRHHALVHRPPTPGRAPVVTCHICHSVLRNKQYLRDHLRKVHGIYQRNLPA